VYLLSSGPISGYTRPDELPDINQLRMMGAVGERLRALPAGDHVGPPLQPVKLILLDERDHFNFDESVHRQARDLHG
jgi:hypothetical protein